MGSIQNNLDSVFEDGKQPHIARVNGTNLNWLHELDNVTKKLPLRCVAAIQFIACKR